MAGGVHGDGLRGSGVGRNHQADGVGTKHGQGEGTTDAAGGDVLYRFDSGFP